MTAIRKNSSAKGDSSGEYTEAVDADMKHQIIALHGSDFDLYLSCLNIRNCEYS